MVELQLKKQRVDQMGKTGDSSTDIVEGEGYVLLSLTIVIALIADFFLMPALVLIFKPFGAEQ